MKLNIPNEGSTTSAINFTTTDGRIYTALDTVCVSEPGATDLLARNVPIEVATYVDGGGSATRLTMRVEMPYLRPQLGSDGHYALAQRSKATPTIACQVLFTLPSQATKDLTDEGVMQHAAAAQVGLVQSLLLALLNGGESFTDGSNIGNNFALHTVAGSGPETATSVPFVQRGTDGMLRVKPSDAASTDTSVGGLLGTKAPIYRALFKRTTPLIEGGTYGIPEV